VYQCSIVYSVVNSVYILCAVEQYFVPMVRRWEWYYVCALYCVFWMYSVHGMPQVNAGPDFGRWKLMPFMLHEYRGSSGTARHLLEE